MKEIKCGWRKIYEEELQKDYFKNLWKFIETTYNETHVYPEKSQIFYALSVTDYDNVKVLLLGQDPYHGPYQAHGLSFSIASDKAKFPPSLRNIFKELESDLGIKREHKNLTDWGEQGILMLNTVLTVEAGQPGSHRGKGWEIFTDQLITALNNRPDPVIFVLWGNDAKKKLSLIDKDKHIIIKSAHPSPLSAKNGFFGSAPFSKINLALRKQGKSEIRW